MTKVLFLFLPFALFSLTVLVVVSQVFLSPVLAFQSKNINATIRISICGDSIAESPEECDIADMSGSSCRSLGYDTGTLTCDIACEFDRTDCVGVAPVINSSPTPVPSTTSNSSSTISPNVTTDITQVTSLAELNAPIPGTRNILQQLSLAQEQIPQKVVFFLQQQTNTLAIQPHASIVKSWVDEWRGYTQILVSSPAQVDPVSNEQLTLKCDVNEDKICNLVDFSVLLYFIEPAN